nr:MAG TPA: hypothetical protein [Caudoviricetes sp.]
MRDQDARLPTVWRLSIGPQMSWVASANSHGVRATPARSRRAVSSASMLSDLRAPRKSPARIRS